MRGFCVRIALAEQNRFCEATFDPLRAVPGNNEKKGSKEGNAEQGGGCGRADARQGQQRSYVFRNAELFSVFLGIALGARCAPLPVPSPWLDTNQWRHREFLYHSLFVLKLLTLISLLARSAPL